MICATCGAQYAGSPSSCPICEDERQWVPEEGQRWTTLEELRAGHRNVVTEEEPGLTSIRTEPQVAIGQRCLLVQTPEGNLLWDCISLVDDESVAAVRARGGLAGIAVSHPHFYGSCVEWSGAFGGVPVWLHAADSAWVARPAPAVVAWEGDEAEPLPGLRLVRLGGHFDGAAVLLWPGGAGGEGCLLTGDTVMVAADRRWVSAMYSYPNWLPLPAATVEGIAARLAGLEFAHVHGAFPGQIVRADAAGAVQRSMARYAERLRGPST